MKPRLAKIVEILVVDGGGAHYKSSNFSLGVHAKSVNGGDPEWVLSMVSPKVVDE